MRLIKNKESRNLVHMLVYRGKLLIIPKLILLHRIDKRGIEYLSILSTDEL